MSSRRKKNRTSSNFQPDVGVLEARTLLSTITVSNSGPADYPSIQAAVVAAMPGDTIKVYPGTYHESVSVPKTLTLQGAEGGKHLDGTADPSKESIVEPPLGSAFNVAANDVVIDGFTVIQAPGQSGINLSAAFSGYRVRENVIDANPNNGVGIHFGSSGAHQSVVERNLFYGSADHGGNQVDGIFANEGLNNAVIRQNLFLRNDSAGVVIINSVGTNSGISIQKNVSYEDGSLVALFGAPGTKVDGNVVLRSAGSSIFVGAGNDGTSITDNTLRDGQARGIRINAPAFGGPANANMTIADNDIRNMALTGIAVAPNSLVNSKILSNESRHNGEDGIWIEAGGNGGNLISRNELDDNARFDAHDDTTGAGTALTANTWSNNEGDTESRPGLLKKKK